MDRISSPTLFPLLTEIEAVERQLEESRRALSEMLFGVVGRIDGPTLRMAAIRLRRDLHNGRAGRPRDWSAILEELDSRERDNTQAVVRLADHLAECEVTFSAAFARELQRARAAFVDEMADANFVCGLLLSSATLYGNLRRYASAVSHGNLRSRDEQIERGLLRYFSRASMKATPFGRFCIVVPGRFTSEQTVFAARERPTAQENVSFVGRSKSARFVVRLNKGLFGIFWQRMKSVPEIRLSMAVELNPTLSEQENAYWCIAVLDGKEVVQRVGKTLGIATVLALLEGGRVAPMRHLIRELHCDPTIDATEDDATLFVNHLVETGVVQFRTGIGDQSVEWERELAAWLRATAHPEAIEMATYLDTLGNAAANYANGDHVERACIARRIEVLLHEIGMRFQLKPGFLRGPALYEDMSADATVHVKVGRRLGEALSELEAFASVLAPIASPRIEQARLRLFYDLTYRSHVCVPLLEFYEALSRELVEHPAPERRGQSLGGPSWLPKSIVPGLEHAIVAKRQAIIDCIEAHWRTCSGVEEVRVPIATLASITADLPARRPIASMAAFCQIVSSSHEANAARIVVAKPAFFMGHGKFFSRFLHLFSEDVRSEISFDNNDARDELRAEICSAGDFTGDLHPALLPWDISCPNAEGSRGDCQLRVADLDVMASESDANALDIVERKTGQRVVPHDLGFLSPARRPALQRALSSFSPITMCAFPLPEHVTVDVHNGSLRTSADGASSAADSIRYRPRIVIGDSVVVCRRSWLVPQSLIPTPGSAEGPAAFFRRVHVWRRATGLPERVYVRIHPLAPTTVSSSLPRAASGDPTGNQPCELAQSESDAKRVVRWPEDQENGTDANAVQTIRRVSRDYAKPQFVNFDSPLLVGLFGRLAAGLDHYVVQLEECLPDATDDLLEVDGERRAAEVVIQIDLQHQAHSPKTADVSN